MSRHREQGAGPELHDEDHVVAGWLGDLDPAGEEGTYWERFHQTVMARSQGELARRRAAVEITVLDMVSSWSRTLVPAALAAAAAAAFLLVQPMVAGPERPTWVGVEELLAEGLEGEAVPSRPFNEQTGTEALAVFAAEIF